MGVGNSQTHPPPALGQVMRTLREERGLGQDALARKAGITQTTVSFIERRKVDPHWGTVEKLGEVLGVTMSEIAARVLAREATGGGS
jgi:DNA-binding XRE family transcriptional regulator